MSKRSHDDETDKFFPATSSQAKRQASNEFSSIITPDYTERNVQKISQILFNYLDGRGNSGLDTKECRLSFDEFAILCKAAKCDVVQARALWLQTDKDNSGYLDRGEFFAFCARRDIFPTVAKMAVKVNEKAQESRARRLVADELFDFLDKDKNNMLSWEEFVPLCKGAGCNAAQAQAGWNVADIDESGSLDREEFSKFATSQSCWPVMKKLHGEMQHMRLREVSKISNAIFGELKASKTSGAEFSEYFNLDELSFEQFAKLCKAAGATSRERALMLFKQTDQDGSNTISRKEFAYFCARKDVWPTIQKIFNWIKAKKEKEKKEESKDKKENKK